MKHLQLHHSKKQDCYKEKCNIPPYHNHELVLLGVSFSVVL